MKQFLQNKPFVYSLVLIFIVALPFLVGQSGYFITLFVMTSIFVISAMALNLLVGVGGQISVGHAAFLSVGAYVLAILASRFSIPFWILIPITGVITGIIGLVIGLPAVRLKGHFLAVATLGFGLSIPQIALNWESVTMGYSGLAVSRPSLLSSDLTLFYFIVAMTIGIYFLLKNIVNSSLGRAFIAIRDSEVAAEATGINVSFYKTIMFVLSAFFTGIAGGLYAYWFGFVSPDDFPLTISLLLLAMVVIGGLGSLLGSVVGAILFTIIPHFTDKLVGMTDIVIGLAVVLVILFRPDGIASIKELFKKKTTKNELNPVKEEKINADV